MLLGNKTDPIIMIRSTQVNETVTVTTEATFLAALGAPNYVQKYSWEIQPLSLDDCGIMRALKRTYSPFVISSTSSLPYKTSM